MKTKDLPIFRDRAPKKVLEEACSARGLTLDLLRQLVEIQRQYLGMGSKVGITSDFDACIADFLAVQGKGT